MVSQIANTTTVPSVAFWGAARAVTGSMHLVEANGRALLLDCGAARGAWHEMRRVVFPFPAGQLDAVILSHAHHDHAGNLPVLARQGYTGPIYCTDATRDLLAVTLADSARFKEQDAHVLRVVGGEPDGEAEPLFSREDVWAVLNQCVTLPYDEPREILPGIRLRLVDAGHLLGAAMVHLEFQTGEDKSSLTFTGDLGRRGLPLVNDPAPVPAADLLISECTYGGKRHQPMDAVRATLAEVVRRTAERGGKVLVPAFSLGRTQAIVDTLQREMLAGNAPRVPIFVDSPLAADVAEVYGRYMPIEQGAAVRYVREKEESHELSRRRESCVVVASGGMCEGGRIVQHLKHHIDDPRCAVVLVSYQAPGTPGRQLLERGPTIRLHGRKWNKWAEVVDLNGFSSHADQADLVGQLSPLIGSTGKVCLVHGEMERAEALRSGLLEAGFNDVRIPAEGERVVL